MRGNQKENKDHRYHRIHTETKVEMGRSYSKIKGQKVDKAMHRVAAKEREEVERTTKQKMARWHNREGGNHLD